MSTVLRRLCEGLVVPVIGLVIVARREVVEARVRGLEANLDPARGSVALLGDDELGDAALVGVGLVVVVAVNEDDVVRVLLDGAALTQVRQLWALVLGTPRFDGPVQL